ARIPGASEKLAHEVVGFVQELRRMDLYKLPGVAETLDWATALVALDANDLSPGVVDDTLGAILKYQDDVTQVRNTGVNKILAAAQRDASS
ncbi:MAG TPA: MoxR family ATPase, partial [Roseiflexaceae bacterium]|nr:MoxR family ATPase [Roseiflexaceae bacterium]